ncbi:hypothetical protein KOW79_005774 [Hemibagrus wyckioides]|uniref:Uncharacterized protein n=1 Tax=Hemibagrus wyckioides TaxID=337641 RepID=A0A9D3SQM0_9TELE|nr:hypothetical protein KOW79_005774 [Hemibagrus wyckioides]
MSSNKLEKLNTEKEEQKISHEKALTEMREKHAKELGDMEEMFQAFQVQEALENKLDKLHKDYGKNLREEEDSSFCTMDKKWDYDQRLQERRAMPAKDLYQEMNKNYRDKTQYSRTVKTDAHVRITMESQQKSGGVKRPLGDHQREDGQARGAGVAHLMKSQVFQPRPPQTPCPRTAESMDSQQQYGGVKPPPIKTNINGGLEQMCSSGIAARGEHQRKYRHARDAEVAHLLKSQVFQQKVWIHSSSMEE